MRTRIAITLIAAAVLVAAACSSCGGEMIVYKDPDYGFSFEYEDSWKFQEASREQVPAGASKSVGVFDPRGSQDANNLTFDYFAVSVYDLGSESAPTAEELTTGFADYLRRLEGSDDTFRVIEDPAPAEVNGNPAISIAYMYLDNDQEIRCREYRLVDLRGMVYSLYTQSAVANWENNLVVFDIFLNSFSLDEDTSD